MKLQNILDLSTFEIVRFRVWNQTSQPSDKGLGSKYFNTNSGHEAYGREQIYTPMGWRTAAYMDDIEAINEKLDLIFGDEIDTDTIIDSWKEVQDFLSGIEDTTTLITLLDDKLSKKGGVMESNAYIAWNTYDGDNDVADWGSVTGRGLRIISSSAADSGAPYQYATALHVRGRYYFKLASAGGNTDALYFRNSNRSWKTIAFTDSDITGNAGSATKLQTARKIWGQSFDGTTDVTGSLYFPNQAITFFYDKEGNAINALHFSDTNILHLGYGNRTKGYSTVISGNNVYLYYGSGSQGFILNSSGNVTIGANDSAGSNMKLYVDGHITTSNNKALYGKDTSNNLRQLLVLDNGNDFVLGHDVSGAGYNTYLEGNNIYLRYGKSHAVGLILNSSGNVSIGTPTPQHKLDVDGDVGFSGLANLNGGALIPTGKNMMFGDASGNAIMEYDEDAGAIKITGSVYATGTVASGGKAQEGTGTGGSATVYTFTLTYGKAAYQIENPKRDTNVIVQVYEWNSTTSSWDLILTDVNVTASKITVTFGRTTTVNHMVTVV